MEETKMKKLIALLVALLVLPMAFAVSTGTGIGVDITTEQFAPLVWQCNRSVADDQVEPQLYGAERYNNYAFEGESITWDVLVMDKNGKEKIKDVYATIGSTQGAGNDIEVNCFRTSESNIEGCDATILEEDVAWDEDMMAIYECTLTVETPDSMYGEYFATVEAEDMDGLVGIMQESEFWFLNPIVALKIEGDLVFDNVRPGTVSTSPTLLVQNDADDGSGVLLDMYISGTDFYDSTSSGAKCSKNEDGYYTNMLSLDAFTYDVVNGGQRAPDRSIAYGDTIAQAGRIMDGVQFRTTSTANEYNFLAPGAEMGINFMLSMPEPCNGNFDTGAIYFWGEAI